MADSEITNEIRGFISENVNSVEQLEVLLLFSSFPEKEWTPEAVFTEIQSSQASVSQRLLELSERGLLARSHDLIYRYGPRTEALASAVRAVAHAYKERRIKIIELIYDRADDIQSFADAFKIRKNKPHA